MNFFSPVRPLLRGWILSFAGFGFVMFAISVQFLVLTNAPIAVAVRSSARDWLPWAILTPLLFRLASRFPIDPRRWKSRLPLHLTSCAAVMLLCWWWERVIDPGFRPLPGGPGFDPPFRQGPPPFEPQPDRSRHRPPPPKRVFDLVRLGTFELPMYLMILSAAHAALFYRRAQERATSLARARLEILKGQLQPHFLFNTLNTIAELVHDDPDKADAMIIALSDMLRITLDFDSGSLVPLSREMEFTEHYLSIMQTRFGDRLQYESDIPAETREALVPPFLLQPLVENAILHGIQPKARRGLIIIRAGVADGELLLTVADNGIGLSQIQPQKEGLGVANTRARLQELFPGATSVTLTDNDGVTASIRIPFQVK